MWLGIRDLAGVDRPVDEPKHPVAFEYGLVVLAGPQRVRQHPDLESALPQSVQQLKAVGVEEGMGFPERVISRKRSLVPLADRLDAGIAEHLVERGRARMLASGLP